MKISRIILDKNEGTYLIISSVKDKSPEDIENYRRQAEENVWNE